MKGLVRLCMIISFLVAAVSARGKDLDSLWQKGNDAYSVGEYQNAVSAYKVIEQQGYVSAPLFYNLGNAYYKLKENGRAILYYEKALKLDPSHQDAENNLKIAQQFTLDKIDAVPDFILSTWMGRLMDSMSADQWAVLGIALVGATVLLLLLFRFASASGVRKFSFVLACLAFLLVVLFFIFAFKLRSRSGSRDNAVVMVPVSSIKSAPNATGSNVFILHEGTKVNILENVSGWSRIELPDGRQGWIQTADMEVI